MRPDQLELELELIQPHMTQKPMLRGEAINKGAKRSQPLSCASPEEKRPCITPGAAEIQV
jgi:hypothetical protein